MNKKPLSQEGKFEKKTKKLKKLLVEKQKYKNY